MMSSFAPYGAAWFPALHALSGVFLVSGVILLLAWAIKHLNSERQKYWGGMLILAALILWLIGMTVSIAMPGNGGPAGVRRGAMMPPKQAAMQGETQAKPRSPEAGRPRGESAATSSKRSSSKSSTRGEQKPTGMMKPAGR